MGRNNITGAWGEERAAEFLRKKHYKLVAAGYYCKFGEIDLIVKDRKYLVFVEVKYRSSERTGSPLEAVDVRKQRVISKVASYYCLTHGHSEGKPCRFDVVAVNGEEYTLIKNAFEYAGW